MWTKMYHCTVASIALMYGVFIIRNISATPFASTVGCVSSCDDVATGNYQSCLGCRIYVTCVSGQLLDRRPCASGLLWDDNSKQCDYRSTTCTDDVWELIDNDEGTTIITTGTVEFTDGSNTDGKNTDDGSLIREPFKEDTDLGSNESHSSEFNEKEDNIAGSVNNGNDATSNNNFDDDEDTSTGIGSDSNDSNEGTNHPNVEDSGSSEEDSTSSNESVDKESIGIEDNKDDDDAAGIDDHGNNNNNDDDDDDTIDNNIEDINDKEDDNDENNDDTDDSHHEILESKDIDTNLDADDNDSNEDNEATGDDIGKEETNNVYNPANKTDTSGESVSQGTVINEGTDVNSSDLEVKDGTEEGQGQSTENNAHNNKEIGGSKESVLIDTPEDATLDGDNNLSVGGDDDDDTTTGSDLIPTIGGEQELIDQPIFETNSIESGIDTSDIDAEEKSSNGICPTHFTGLVQDNSNCATYYNCSQGHIVPGRDDCAFLECPYPMLYSEVERACKQYTDVQCGYRYEPQSPCEYSYPVRLPVATREEGLPMKELAHTKSQHPGCPIWSASLPCTHYYPDCRGLPDGNNIWFGRENSPFYSTCQDGRSVDGRICGLDMFGSRMVFWKRQRRCQSIWYIPKLEGGEMPDCSRRRRNGRYSDQLGRCPYYYVCRGREFKGFYKCPVGTLFDKNTKRCEHPDRILNSKCSNIEITHCAGKHDGLYPDLAGRCDWYHRCEHGILRETHRCTPYHHAFNPLTGKCGPVVAIPAPCGPLKNKCQGRRNGVYRDHGSSAIGWLGRGFFHCENKRVIRYSYHRKDA